MLAVLRREDAGARRRHELRGLKGGRVQPGAPHAGVYPTSGKALLESI